MIDSEHIKRGMTVEHEADVSYKWEGIDDGNINSVWYCRECEDKLELRNRRGAESYVEVGCSCGAVSVHLRIGGVLGLDIDKWESVPVEDLDR